MKKISIRNLYLIFIICIGLVCLGIGSTYAVFTASSEIISPISLSSNLTYESGVLETINVKVLPGEVISTKVNITNNSNSNLNYVTWYIDEGYDINVVGETGDMQGVISPLSTSTIVVSVRNSGDYTTAVNIGVSSSVDSIVLGNNMKVVDSANFMMGTEINPSDDTALFLRSNLQRGEIETITFVDNINIPEGTTSVDVSKHNDSSVMMWYGDKNSNNLYDVYIGAENGTTFLSSGWCLFKYLTNVKKIEFSNCINTGNVTNMASMFNNCTSLTELDVSNFDTSAVTAMNAMFFNCYSLIEIDVSNFDTSNVTKMGWMFQMQEVEGALSSSLEKIKGINNFDTSNVKEMQGMFYGCGELTSLDVSNFNTSKVEDMEYMFHNCIKITKLDVDNFDTSKVTNMAYMFYGCYILTELNVSNFDTSNVTSMKAMFYNCYSLTEINVSKFATSKVTNMAAMFYNCYGLTLLDVTSFDTSRVTNMQSMFNGCTKLVELDISSFDTSNVTNILYIFNNCSKLVTIYVSDKWNTIKVTNSADMFTGATSLVGGSGTTYDANYIDKTYARVDGGTSSPGYFTYKNV